MPDLAEATGAPVVSDQTVIDAVVSDDDERVSRLARQLGGVEAMDARATSLGLTAGFLKKTRAAGSRASMRTCLRCDVRFLSSGTQNRLCQKCLAR